MITKIKISKRFSDDQKDLSKSLKFLLKIYYSSDYSKPEEEWPWEEINQNIKELFSNIFGTECDCEFDINKRKVRIKTSGKISHKYTINIQQMRKFASMMKDLCDEISKQQFHHLELAGLFDMVQTEVKATQKNVTKQKITLINNTITKSIPKDYKSDYEEDNHKNIYVKYHRKYRVRPFTGLGNALLLIDETKKIKKIEHYTSEKIKSFSRLSRYILIYYHLVFNSFDRIKLCNLKDCQKMYFEKYKGRGTLFCSGKCRKKNNDSQWPEEKKKCHDNQNQWISGKITKQKNDKKAFLVPKYRCLLECKQVMKRGCCEILLDLNKEALKF